MRTDRVVFFESFAMRCKYFQDTDHHPCCRCNHPAQEEQDLGIGKCYIFSCPLGDELMPEDYEEDRMILRRAGVGHPSNYSWLLLGGGDE